jgi:hypothetical protein
MVSTPFLFFVRGYTPEKLSKVFDSYTQAKQFACSGAHYGHKYFSAEKSRDPASHRRAPARTV